ncbi:MAG: ribosomal protein S18-alanine N-acetyltransferase [Gammaproteobacteria bacterium]
MSARPELPPLPVRPMTEYDLHEVAAIEQDVYAFPWSYAIFKDCLRVGYSAVVLESDEGIRGYAVMSSAVAEAHLLNICIHPAWHGCGVGRQLLDWLFQEARCLGARRIFLEVRPSNMIALQLYESAGFARIGLRKDYYRSETGREDAIVLEHRLDPA